MVEGCDAPYPSVYFGPNGTMTCRCLICARCEKHTGDSNYGHYTRVCKNWPKPEEPRTMQEFSEMIKKTPHHFCCPDNCELNK